MPTREEQELETLKANSPYALPDDAAASGWTTAQKKEKFYAGLLYLYELFKASRSSTEGTVSEFTQKVDTFTNMVNAFIEADKASKDGDNNVISATYAKIANIANGTIPAVKYKKGENETENINAIEPRLMVLINQILGYFTGGKANNALSADKATSDGDGRSIKTTYATKTEAATIQTAINNVLNGASTVAKSLGDGNGNTISSTYETKSDATAKVARTNLVSIIGEATTSLSGLLSATDKSRLDALYALLGASDDADTVVNTINEVLAIFSQYPEGVTLTNALALKVAISDIVDNLTTQDATKPLSAKQGYVLKGLIDALIPVDNLTSTSTTAPLTAKQGKVLKGLIDDLERWYLALSGIAEDYDSTSTYSKGDVVANSGNLFRAKADITTAEEWTAAHWESVTVVELINEKLSKGDYDGTTGVGYADVADNFTPYSDESGAFQDNPVISQGTGTDNNTAIVTTGDFAQLREKQGNSVVVNQLVNLTDTASTSWGGGTYSISSKKITVVCDASESTVNANIITLNIPIVSGHKYAILASGLPSNHPFILYSSTVSLAIGGIQSATGSGSVNLRCYQAGGFAEQTTYTFTLIVIDLTQWFNGDIPQDLLDNPSHFSWYYNGSLAYNPGSLENSDGRYLVCTGRNLFDGELESGAISDQTGADVSASGYWRSKNKLPCVPNKPHYLKFGNSAWVYWYDSNENFISATDAFNNNYKTAPSNAFFYRLVVYSATKPTAVTFSLYYTPEQGGEGYDQYYPYQEPKVYDTGTEELLRIPVASGDDVLDSKLPNGAITHRVGSYTCTGSEPWTLKGTSPNQFFESGNISNAGQSSSLAGTSTDAGVYVAGIYYQSANNGRFRVYLHDNPQLDENSNLNNIFTNGKTINYRLATPTTEQGTPFAENIEIDDYGMMYWLDTDGNLVDVPQGAKFFYPVSYKGFTDDLYSRTEGDASNVALESEITDTALAERGYYKMQDLSSGITDVAGLTYTLKKAIKTGNLVNLTIRCKNQTGSAISGGSTLFSLASGLYPSAIANVFAIVKSSNILMLNIGGTGNATIYEALNNNEELFINISYAVA